MKKIASGVLLCLVVVLLNVSFGTDEIMKIKGTVAAIDPTAPSVEILQTDGKKITIVMEDHADEMAKIKQGEKAEVYYYVKKGKLFGYQINRMPN